MNILLQGIHLRFMITKNELRKFVKEREFLFNNLLIILVFMSKNMTLLEVKRNLEKEVIMHSFVH